MSTKELLFAGSTVWVVIAAVLVMFMQAGFAFLEAGLTRMKNVGHIAAKNVLILALASVVYYLVGFGLAFGDGGGSLVGGSGFAPSFEELLTIGASGDTSHGLASCRISTAISAVATSPAPHIDSEAIAWISWSVKPLAMRSITVPERVPDRKSCMALTIAAWSRPFRRGTGEVTRAEAG